MTRFLLDSTVHIHWSRNEPRVLQWLRETIQPQNEHHTSVISVAEVYARAHPHESPALNDYFSALTVLGITHEDAVAAGRLRYDLARAGRQLQLADALIAATALAHGATVVTANTKDFAQTGVPLVELRP